MEKKIAVVSVVTGAYDTKIYEPQNVDKDKYDFILFTNMKRIKSTVWDIKYNDLKIPNNISKSAYYYKWNLHNILDKNKYDYVIWVDSSIWKFDFNKFDEFVDEFIKSDNALWIEKHPSNNLVKNELNLNVKLKKDNIDKMVNQVNRYYNEGYKDKDDSCVETGFSLRKLNDNKLNNMCDLIWSEMKDDSSTKRDQLIYDYALWKSRFSNYKLFTFQEKCEILQFQDHPNRAKHMERVLMVGPWYGNPKYEPEWVAYVEEYLGKTPIDTVMVGCRLGHESLYESIQPDKFFISDPEGAIRNNLLGEKVPRFSVTSKDKEIIQLNPDSKSFNRLKLFDDSVHFKVEITGWKVEKYIDRCIASLLKQKHTNWEACIVLDPSDDNTYSIAKKYESDKIKVVMNDERMGSLYNHRKCVKLMNPNPEDVVMTLDSDDWFAHDRVMTVIENTYLRYPDTLVTHGSWIDYPNPGSLKPNNSQPYHKEEFNDIRHAFFKGTHVRTIKAKIWNSIKEEDLKNDNGEYFETAGDVALMIPSLEMAGFDRVKFIPDVMYIYNRETVFNDDKFRTNQGDNHIQITNKKPYTLYTEVGTDIIVFSKDRAMQLDAFLRSMKKHHKNLDSCSVNILYKCSDEIFDNGYEILCNKYPEFNFVKETSFKENLVNICKHGTKSTIQFFVDDIIWKSDFSFDDDIYKKFESDESVLALSLRLHPDITFCHPLNRDIAKPEMVNNMWDWKDCEGDWGYPMSVDGNIFKKRDVINSVEKFSYTNPNLFEATITIHNTSTKKQMICYDKSKLFNIPMNRVQNVFSNLCGDVSPELLNEKFISGKTINIDKFVDFKNISCHQDVEVEFDGENKFDVFLVCGIKDYQKLPFCVDAIKQNVVGFDNIHICTPNKVDIDGVIWHNENDVLEIDKSRINHRPNWIYQQFLKLFQDVTENDYYMTIDADTIINKPMSMFTDDGKPIWNISFAQNHRQYYVYNNAMFGYERHTDHTFLADMNFFSKKIIKSMLDKFDYTVESFVEKSYGVIKSGECYPSEADVYGNFFTKYHPDLYSIRQISSNMEGRHCSVDEAVWSEDEIKNKIDQMKFVDVDTFSMHSWT